jgi:hypothetical protein
MSILCNNPFLRTVCQHLCLGGALSQAWKQRCQLDPVQASASGRVSAKESRLPPPKTIGCHFGIILVGPQEALQGGHVRHFKLFHASARVNTLVKRFDAFALSTKGRHEKGQEEGEGGWDAFAGEPQAYSPLQRVLIYLAFRCLLAILRLRRQAAQAAPDIETPFSPGQKNHRRVTHQRTRWMRALQTLEGSSRSWQSSSILDIAPASI